MLSRNWFVGVLGFVSAAGEVSALDYKRDVMPIFEEKCFKCHSASAEKVKGGLRLDDPEHLHKRFAKNDLVIPGDWDGSYLFVTVSRHPGAEDAMPPKAKKGDGKSLTPEEVMTVAKWIYEGAKVDGEKGKKGDKDDDPEDFLKFRDGLLVTDSFDELEDGEGKAKAEEPEPKVKPLEWTNAEGRKIKALFQGVEGDRVLLELDGGKKVKYPIKQLSEKSRAMLKALVEVDEKEAGDGG